MRFTHTFIILLVSLLALAGYVQAEEEKKADAIVQGRMRAAVLKLAPGGYDALDQELKDFLESGQKKNRKYTKRITREEVEDLPNPQLVFISEEGEEAETVFVSYIPVSMVKSIMRGHKWTKLEENKEEQKEEKKTEL